MAITTSGFLRPSVDPNLDAEEHARLLSLCPGAHVDLPHSNAPYNDLSWGSYHRLLKAHSTDAELRYRGSSGGVISAVANFLLESARVDFILHVGADPAAPLRSRIQISRDRAALIEAVGARYGPAAPLETIGDLLALGRPFAVVGKPCDIAGVRNLARNDPRVAELVQLTIAFFCAGVSSSSVSENIVRKFGLAPRDVKVMRYRGHGCPGATHIEAKDGRIFEQSYDETWSEELNQDIQFRCKICPDSTGEHADIACGDAWISGDGYSHFEREGWNSVIVRTEAGVRVLSDLEAAPGLTVEPLSLCKLGQMQPHQVERKTEVMSRLLGLRLRGALVPQFNNLRLLQNARAGRRRLWRTLLGTYRRVGKGANRETIACPPIPNKLAGR